MGRGVRTEEKAGKDKGGDDVEDRGKDTERKKQGREDIERRRRWHG